MPSQSALLCASLMKGAVLLLLLPALASGALAPTYVVDFRPGNNLKALFDGGSRPTRLLGLEEVAVTLNDSSLAVIFPDDRRFELQTERASFHVLEEGVLSTADFIGEVTSLEEAIATARRVCTGLKLSTASLDREAAVLRATPQASRGWGSRGSTRDNIDLHVRLIGIDGVTRQFGNVGVHVTWDVPSLGKRFLTEPIPPPPGYEGVSMEPRKPRHTPPPPSSPGDFFAAVGAWVGVPKPPAVVRMEAFSLMLPEFKALWFLWVPALLLLLAPAIFFVHRQRSRQKTRTPPVRKMG